MIIEHEAQEIIHLVASVRLFVSMCGTYVVHHETQKTYKIIRGAITNPCYCL